MFRCESTLMGHYDNKNDLQRANLQPLSKECIWGLFCYFVFILCCCRWVSPSRLVMVSLAVYVKRARAHTASYITSSSHCFTTRRFRLSRTADSASSKKQSELITAKNLLGQLPRNRGFPPEKLPALLVYRANQRCGFELDNIWRIERFRIPQLKLVARLVLSVWPVRHSLVVSGAPAGIYKCCGRSTEGCTGLSCGRFVPFYQRKVCSLHLSIILSGFK